MSPICSPVIFHEYMMNVTDSIFCMQLVFQHSQAW